MREQFVCGVVVLSAAAVAGAGISNADFEAGPQDFGEITDWSGGGGTANHGPFVPMDGVVPPELGSIFGFFDGGGDPGNDEPYQISTDAYRTGTVFSFGSWATGGGNGIGTVIYQLGYFDDGGAFVEVASESVVLDGSWRPYAGVSINGDDLPPAAIGRLAVVKFGDAGIPMGDVWVDNVTFVPAPGAALLLGLSGLTLVRRRR